MKDQENIGPVSMSSGNKTYRIILSLHQNIEVYTSGRCWLPIREKDYAPRDVQVRTSR